MAGDHPAPDPAEYGFDYDDLGLTPPPRPRHCPTCQRQADERKVPYAAMYALNHPGRVGSRPSTTEEAPDDQEADS